MQATSSLRCKAAIALTTLQMDIIEEKMWLQSCFKWMDAAQADDDNFLATAQYLSPIPIAQRKRYHIMTFATKPVFTHSMSIT